MRTSVVFLHSVHKVILSKSSVKKPDIPQKNIETSFLEVILQSLLQYEFLQLLLLRNLLSVKNLRFVVGPEQVIRNAANIICQRSLIRAIDINSKLRTFPAGSTVDQLILKSTPKTICYPIFIQLGNINFRALCCDIQCLILNFQSF